MKNSTNITPLHESYRVDYKDLFITTGMQDKLDKFAVPEINLEFVVVLLNDMVFEGLNKLGFRLSQASYEEIVYNLYNSLSRKYSIRFLGLDYKGSGSRKILTGMEFDPYFIQLEYERFLKIRIDSKSADLGKIFTKAIKKEFNKVGMKCDMESLEWTFIHLLPKYYLLSFSARELSLKERSRRIKATVIDIFKNKDRTK